jgi:ribonuclease-3
VLANDNLARVGFEKKLDTYVRYNGRTPLVSPKLMATTVGALLGAVHLDGGDHALEKVMKELGLIKHDYLVKLTIPIIYLRNLRSNLE